MQLAQLAKNNAEQKCQELQRKLSKLEANICTQDGNLWKILEENKNLQAQLTGANEVILKEGNFYRNYIDTLKVDFSTIVREHTELKNHDCDQEQSLLDDKGLISKIINGFTKYFTVS